MAYFNYNNAKLQIGASTGNASPYFCESVGINLSSKIDPVYLTSDRSSFDFKSNGDIDGSLSFSYYLTGEDPLKEFMANEKSSLSGDFAGLEFKSGYLTSYSFGFENYRPVLVNAQIQFYGGVSGTFTPKPERDDNVKKQFLNFSDCQVTDYSGVVVSDSIIANASYSFTSQIDPVYIVDEILPKEVRFGTKQTSINFTSYSLANGVSFSGEKGEISINLKDSGDNTKETYKIRGTLNTQTYDASAGSKITTKISLTQNSLDNAPKVTGFSSQGAVGEIVSLTGSFLEDAVRIDFRNDVATGFDVVKTSEHTELITYVPPKAIDGYITVQTLGGKTKTATTFEVTNDTSFWNA